MLYSPYTHPDRVEGTRSTAAGKRPKLSLASLIGQAILGTPERRARLGQIYEWVAERYPEYYTLNQGGWQNSIRHNLTINKAFVRMSKEEGDSVGKGAYWTIHPDHLNDFQDGVFVGKVRGAEYRAAPKQPRAMKRSRSDSAVVSPRARRAATKPNNNSNTNNNTNASNNASSTSNHASSNALMPGAGVYFQPQPTSFEYGCVGSVGSGSGGVGGSLAEEMDHDACAASIAATMNQMMAAAAAEENSLALVEDAASQLNHAHHHAMLYGYNGPPPMAHYAAASAAAVGGNPHHANYATQDSLQQQQQQAPYYYCGPSPPFFYNYLLAGSHVDGASPSQTPLPPSLSMSAPNLSVNTAMPDAHCWTLPPIHPTANADDATATVNVATTAATTVASAANDDPYLTASASLDTDSPHEDDVPFPSHAYAISHLSSMAAHLNVSPDHHHDHSNVVTHYFSTVDHDDHDEDDATAAYMQHHHHHHHHDDDQLVDDDVLVETKREKVDVRDVNPSDIVSSRVHL